MRILLSGTGGFLGRHLLEKFVEEGYAVAALVRPEKWDLLPEKVKQKTTSIKADFNQKESTIKELCAFAPDTFIHMGWHGVENSLHEDYSQVEVNIAYTLNLLTILKPLALKRIIGIGSQAEYGPKEKPIDELTPTTPKTLYGIAKLTAYHLFEHFCAKNEFNFTWVRVFSTYGPSDNSSWLIPTLIKAFTRHECPKLTLGEQQWDYLYLSDAIEALFKITLNDRALGVFNLGSGRTNSIRELVNKIHVLTNSKAILKFGERPYNANQVMYLKADISRLMKTIDWKPKVSLDDGLEKLIQST